MSVLNDVLDAAVAAVAALGLQLNAVPVPVVKRKLPKREENVDPPVQVTVCKGEEPEKEKPYSFGGAGSGGKYTKRVEYLVEVTVISPNNNDQLTNLPQYAQWREQIRTLFSTTAPFAGVPAVWKSFPAPKVFLDRRKISENYDYQVVGVTVTTREIGG